ncbi:MAG: hypothetical protein NTY37_01870 [Methanothrix sp.]|nr:hypothetical protein [Methanothrix sp.]
MELAKLRAVKVGGKWKLTEISKKQRTILEKMKIGIPVEANLVIKRLHGRPTATGHNVDVTRSSRLERILLSRYLCS